MALRQMANNLRSRVSLHPLFVDLGLTTATELTVLAGGLLVVSLFSRMLGAVALGDYLLVRRVYSWLQSAALWGLTGALPRYVAHAVDRSASERATYFTAVVACGSVSVLCLGTILIAARRSFAHWLFGSAQTAHLILPLSLLLAGGAAHDTVYGYYRGRLAMKRANALQLCDLVLVPIGSVLAFFRTGSVAVIVSAIGVLMLVCSALFTAPIIRQLAITGVPRFGRHAAELLRYGIPRLPAGLAHGALFALPPIIAAHFRPVAQVSYLLLGVNLLLAAASSLSPLGLILLSKASMMLAQNRRAELRARLAYLLAAVPELYVFACLQLVVFADLLIRVWVGPSFLKGIGIIRLVPCAIPFYLFFVSLRSVIDATSITAYNTYNIFAASGVLLGLVAIAVKLVPAHMLLQSLAGAMVVAIAVLAWLTGRTFRRLYDLSVDWKRSALPLLLGVLLGGTSLFLHWAQGFRTGLGQFFLIQLASGALFLGLLKRWGSPWLLFVWNSVFRQPSEELAVMADARDLRQEDL